MITMITPVTDYRRALNALRGFAAIYVVLYHLRYFTTFDWLGNIPALQFGYIGVDFFFILSGLIISHVYLEKSKSAGPQFWFKFVWLRLSRLLPVHVLIMALMLVAALIGPLLDSSWSPVKSSQIADWFSLTFLVRQWLLPDGYSWNSPAWSVSAELFAYVFVFPIVSLVARNESKTIGITLMVMSAVLWSLLMVFEGTVNAVRGAGPLIRVTAGFLAGIGLFIISTSKTWTSQKHDSLWNSILPVTLAASLPIWAVALTLQASGQSPDLLLICYLAILICATYRGSGRISDVLGSRPLFWLGEVSFALYLCHVPVLSALAYLADLAGIARGAVFGIISAAICLVVAHLLCRFVEMPAREQLRQWYDRKGRAQVELMVS